MVNQIIQSTASLRTWNRLFRDAQKGSREAIEKLFELTEPEIKHMAKNYSPRSCYFDDFYAEGCETYMNIISQPQKKIQKPRNYLMTYIRQQMKRLRYNIRLKDRQYISVDDFKFSEDEKKLNLTKQYGYKGFTRENQANSLFLKEVLLYIAGLPKRVRDVLTEGVINGNNGSEVAQKLNLTEDNIFQIISRERKKIKKWTIG